MSAAVAWHTPRVRRANLRALERATAALDRVVDAHTGVCEMTIGSVAVESIDLGRRIAQAIAEARTRADTDERAALDDLDAIGAEVVRNLDPDDGCTVAEATLIAVASALAGAICTVVALDGPAVEGEDPAIAAAVRERLALVAHGGPTTTLRATLRHHHQSLFGGTRPIEEPHRGVLDAIGERAASLEALGEDATAGIKGGGWTDAVAPAEWLAHRSAADALLGIAAVVVEAPLDHATLKRLEQAIAEAARLGLGTEVAAGCDAIGRLVVADALATQGVRIAGGTTSIARILAARARLRAGAEGRQPLTGWLA